MSDLSYLLLFLFASFTWSVIPGPDVLYILTKTIANGKKVGIASVLGVFTGSLLHVFLAVFGLSATIASSVIAFTFIKVVGACYLVFLAYQAFRSSGTSLDMSNTTQPKETPFYSFKQGVLVDILNPKVAVFFVAFLPQFIRNDHGSTLFQLLYLGLIFVFIALIVEVIYVLVASKLTEKVRSNKKISVWLNRIVATVFLTLGINLATTSV